MRVNPTVTWVTREALEDVEFQGLHIPKGGIVQMLSHAAGTDPRAVPDPSFDITQQRPPHHGFGAGIHHCLGHFVARTDMAVALPLLAQRMPDAAPRRRRSVAAGLRATPVRCRSRSASARPLASSEGNWLVATGCGQPISTSRRETGGSGRLVVHEAPAPVLVGLGGLHHRVGGVVEVLGGVLHRPRSRSRRRCRTRGTGAATPTGSPRRRSAGRPAPPRSRPPGSARGRGSCRRCAGPTRSRARSRRSSVAMSSIDSSTSSSASTSATTSEATVPALADLQHPLPLGLEHRQPDPGVEVAGRLPVRGGAEPLPGREVALVEPLPDQLDDVLVVVVLQLVEPVQGRLRRLLEQGGAGQCVLGRVGAGHPQPLAPATAATCPG